MRLLFILLLLLGLLGCAAHSRPPMETVMVFRDSTMDIYLVPTAPRNDPEGTKRYITHIDSTLAAQQRRKR